MLGSVLEIRDEPDTMSFADYGGTVNKVYVQFGPILFWMYKMKAVLLCGDLSREYFISMLFVRKPMLSFPSILLSLIELQSQPWQQRQGRSGWKDVCENKNAVTGQK